MTERTVLPSIPFAKALWRLLCELQYNKMYFSSKYFFSFGATAPIGALAYLHETFRFTSVY
jgi:hypothetical protein